MKNVLVGIFCILISVVFQKWKRYLKQEAMLPLSQVHDTASSWKYDFLDSTLELIVIK